MDTKSWVRITDEMPISGWTFIEALSFRMRATIVLICAVAFGASLTTYVMLMPGRPYLMQIVASCIKVPSLLFLGPIIALFPTLLLSKFFEKNVDVQSILRASFACIFGKAIILGICAPFIAVLNTLSNYTLTIFASYAAFATAGLIGCFAFYLKLKRNSSQFSSRSSASRISIIWFVLFGPISAEVTWSIRPLVGWTGQPFEWYRSDNIKIWDQLSAEADNLRVGGLSFPLELEKRFTK